MSIDLSKYQPTSIDDIVFGNPNAELKIKRIVSGQKDFPALGKQALLLYGVWGTGKSTLAKLLPDAIEQGKTGEDGEISLMYECSDGDSGVKLATKIFDSTKLVSPNSSKLYYVIINEFDCLNKRAQASLKGVLDRTWLVVIFTSNAIEKIDRGIKDRAHKIEMNAAQPQQWLPLCQRILNDMGVDSVSNQQLIPIIEGANGSVRKIADGIEDLALAIHSARQPKAPNVPPLRAVK